jgi:predicted Zn-dependent protease
MSNNLYFKTLSAVVAVLLLLGWSTPGWAISLKEEQELSQQFMRMVYRNYELIDDPLIRGYVSQVGRKILARVPPQPFTYHFHVVQEKVYNAFAIPAGHIFINSGLLLAMDDEDELAGILAHEISHVVCRHISKRIDQSKKIDLATMAGVVAGIFLGVAGGSPEAAQALTLGSLAAGQSVSLAHSREDESQADQHGLEYLTKAGYSAEGLLDILKKIRGKEWFGPNQIPTYMMTHPAIEERIARIDNWLAAPGHDRKEKPPSRQFHRMQYRLRALYGDPNDAIQFFKSGLAAHPSDMDMVYGYGLTMTRIGNYDQAVRYLQQALTQNALDPVVLGDLGKVYFLSGRTKQALEVLKGAASLPDPNPEGLFYLGRTYIELGDYTAAVDSLERVLQIQDDYPPAYYFLGEAYGKLGRDPDAHFFLGMFHFKKGDDRLAYHHLMLAKKQIQDPAKQEIIKKTLEIIKKLPKEKVG